MLKNKTFFITLIISVLFIGLKLSAAQADFVYDSHSKRNPFIALVTPDGRLLKLDVEEGNEALALEGIIFDENGVSYAIVNQDVVNVGDYVGDYQVLKIEKDEVRFVREGQLFVVKLKKEEE
ncbi:MAG: hypothetical protein C4533_04355 [Candidatus Omnitrophota bacterium]|jgi:hypothetical protein|nr:MAG: hypothetical protein C4533_04355 [Candidatus Omnitrophota bacterium]